MMAFSEGTQFGLDFGIVEINGWNIETAKLLAEPRFALASQFSSFTEGELAYLE